MKYMILIGNDLNELTNAVNAAISLGWTPQGGVCISKNQSIGTSISCYQAMIKHEPNDIQPKGSTFHQWEQQEHENNKNIRT